MLDMRSVDRMTPESMLGDPTTWHALTVLA